MFTNNLRALLKHNVLKSYEANFKFRLPEFTTHVNQCKFTLERKRVYEEMILRIR